ncbi:unnamed protein product [Nippostrongylus brasiliensis]|uniref:Post-GPI attachment to proteins factor 3 n=1 Tax=Nippostrongylus brasiliensis TaxID=27835 RepID=A0A0N4XLN6_NIPBR|nr:unnamed protein product [Nippostrongylus brasiliensis]
MGQIRIHHVSSILNRKRVPGAFLGAVNCDDCCEEDLCNANFSVQYYQEMMSRQYTSWIVPLPGEVNWNKRNNYKFPY